MAVRRPSAPPVAVFARECAAGRWPARRHCRPASPPHRRGRNAWRSLSGSAALSSPGWAVSSPSPHTFPPAFEFQLNAADIQEAVGPHAAGGGGRKPRPAPAPARITAAPEHLRRSRAGGPGAAEEVVRLAGARLEGGLAGLLGGLLVRVQPPHRLQDVGGGGVVHPPGGVEEPAVLVGQAPDQPRSSLAASSVALSSCAAIVSTVSQKTIASDGCGDVRSPRARPARPGPGRPAAGRPGPRAAPARPPARPAESACWQRAGAAGRPRRRRGRPRAVRGRRPRASRAASHCSTRPGRRLGVVRGSASSRTSAPLSARSPTAGAWTPASSIRARTP